MNDDARQMVVDALLSDADHHIEFHGHLTNHNKHAVIALAGLGASARQIAAYYHAYAANTPYGFPLEPARPSAQTITVDNWSAYLGKRSSFTGYCQFFAQRIQEAGEAAVLQQYLPILLPGWVGAFTHAAIHLGWALHIQHPQMIVEGLAYMAFAYVPCHPTRACVSTSRRSGYTVYDALLHALTRWHAHRASHVASVQHLFTTPHAIDQSMHPELRRSGLQYRIAKVAALGHPVIEQLPAWVNARSPASVWQELYFAVTLLYMARPGDFIVLHYLTSLFAMERMASSVPHVQQREVIQAYWVGLLTMLVANPEDLPTPELFATLLARYRTACDDNEPAIYQSAWSALTQRAIGEVEEHNPKLVYVLQQVWHRSGYRTIYRHAASHFTTTPVLPPSFKEPPYVESIYG